MNPREEDYLDPQLAALQALSKVSRGGGAETDEDGIREMPDQLDVAPQEPPQAASMPSSMPFNIGALEQQAAVQTRTRGPLSEIPQEDSEPTQASAEGMQRYVRAPTTRDAYRELPASAMPQQAPPQQSRGFDWGRAMTAMGGGDVGAYDANRRYGEEAPTRAKSAQMTDLRMKDLEEDIGDRQTQRQRLRAMMDPNSVESKTEQENFTSIMRARASAPGIGKGTADYFNQLASQAPTMSAQAIARAKLASDQIYGDTFKAIDSMNRGQKIEADDQYKQQMLDATLENHGMQNADRQHDNRTQDMLANETVRHNRAVEERQNAPKPAQNPPQTIIKEQALRNTVLKEISRVEQLLSSGKIRYTGMGAESVDSVLGQLPGAADPRNAEERELSSILRSMRAPLRNKIYGAALSKYDIKDSNSFMAGIGNNPEQLKTNLATLRAALSDQNEQVTELYPALMNRTDDLPRTKGDPAAFKTPTAARKAPEGSKPGQRFKTASGKRFVVQDDMTLKEVQ